MKSPDLYRGVRRAIRKAAALRAVRWSSRVESLENRATRKALVLAARRVVGKKVRKHPKHRRRMR